MASAKTLIERAPAASALMLAGVSGAFFAFYWTDPRRQLILLAPAFLLGGAAFWTLRAGFQLVAAPESEPADPPLPESADFTLTREAADALCAWLEGLRAATGALQARLFHTGTDTLRQLAQAGGRNGRDGTVHPLRPGPLTFALETGRPCQGESGDTRLGYVKKAPIPFIVFPLDWRGARHLLVLDRKAVFSEAETASAAAQTALFGVLMYGIVARRDAALKTERLEMEKEIGAGIGRAESLAEMTRSVEAVFAARWKGVSARLAFSGGRLVEPAGEREWDERGPGWAKWALEHLEKPMPLRQPTSPLPLVPGDLDDGTGAFRLGVLIPLAGRELRAVFALRFPEPPGREVDELVEAIHPRLRDAVARLAALGAAAQAAETDPLTGLLNRRGFTARYGNISERGKVALLAIDLDHFKKVNDQRGHAAGDAVLKRTAELIRAALREGDLGARLGGEELAVLLPGTDLAGARLVAERLRAALAAERFESPAGDFTVTMSIGLSARAGRRPPLAEILEEADAALYKAKEEGRNRVVGG